MTYDQFLRNPAPRFEQPDDCRPCSLKVDALLGRYTEIDLDAVADAMLDEIVARHIEGGEDSR